MKEKRDKQKMGSSGIERPIASSKKEKWKADSEAFREAMRAGKQLKKAMDTGKL